MLTQLVSLLNPIQGNESAADNKKGFHLNHEAWDSLNMKQKEFVRYTCTEMIYEEIAEKMFVSSKTADG